MTDEEKEGLKEGFGAAVGSIAGVGAGLGICAAIGATAPIGVPIIIATTLYGVHKGSKDPKSAVSSLIRNLGNILGN